MDKKLIMSKQWFIDAHSGNIKDVYHFIKRLGSGGFGVVYLAEHRKNGKPPFPPRLTLTRTRHPVCH
jgi:serine/threonine protein kinase